MEEERGSKEGVKKGDRITVKVPPFLSRHEQKESVGKIGVVLSVDTNHDVVRFRYEDDLIGHSDQRVVEELGGWMTDEDNVELYKGE